MIIKYNKNIISKLNKRIFSGNDLLIIGVLGNEDNLSKIEIEDKLNNCISRNTMIRCLKQLTDVNILVRFKKGKVYKYSLNKKYKRGQVLIPYSLLEDCINKKNI